MTGVIPSSRAARARTTPGRPPAPPAARPVPRERADA
jgi:hypothetical protein